MIIIRFFTLAILALLLCGNTFVFAEAGGSDYTRGYNNASSAGNSSSSVGNFASSSFTLETSNLTPTEKKYNQGTRANITNFLTNAGKYLLIGVMTFAVLSIAIGGLMIATTGPSDRHAKGKTIIQINIMAIVLALLSYSIVQFVRWILSV